MRWDEGDENRALDESYLRVEYQTLRKLPQTGNIVFTVRIYLDPLAFVGCHSRRQQHVKGLYDSLAGLDEAQLAYKGLANWRDRLLAHLEAAGTETVATKESL